MTIYRCTETNKKMTVQLVQAKCIFHKSQVELFQENCVHQLRQICRLVFTEVHLCTVVQYVHEFKYKVCFVCVCVLFILVKKGRGSFRCPERKFGIFHGKREKGGGGRNPSIDLAKSNTPPQYLAFKVSDVFCALHNCVVIF